MTVAMAFCMLFAFGAFSASADEVAETPVAPTTTNYEFVMNEGVSTKVEGFNDASIRNAIRFTTTLKVSDVQSAMVNFDVKIKTIIVKAEELGDEVFTKENLDAKGINYQQVIFTEEIIEQDAGNILKGENYVFNACLYNIQDENFTKEFSAISYVEINGVATQYTETTATRSLWDVADAHKTALETKYNGKDNVLVSEDADEYKFVSSLCATYKVTLVGFDGNSTYVTLKHGQTLASKQAEIEQQLKALDVAGTAYYAGTLENVNLNEAITKDTTVNAVMRGLKFAQVDGGYTVTGANFGQNDSTLINIPATYKGEDVVSVADNAFQYDDFITEINFPEGIALGSYAFQYCSKLEELDLPKLASIGDCTFRGCTSLKKVVFPQGTENRFNMGDWVFADCTALELADIRNISYLGAEHDGFRVGSKMFYNCTSLKAVIVGRTFKVQNNPSFDIDGTTQYTPQGIYYVDLYTGTSTVEGNRLDTNGSGGNVIMSGRVYMIGCQTYLSGDLGKIVDGENGSWYMGEDEMPVAVGHASIGTSSTTYTYNEGTENEFSATIYVQSSYHENLKREEHVYVENVCTICGHNEFGTLTYEYSEEKGGYVLVSDDNFTGTVVNIPATYNGEKVVAIGENAFKNNATITQVTFPEGIEIGKYAFGYCPNIQELNFPKLASLGACAFEGCSGLKKVVFPKGGENSFDIGDWAFGLCTSLEYVDIRNVATLGGTDYYTDTEGITHEYTTGVDLFYGCVSLKTFILPNRFVVNNRQFGMGGTDLSEFNATAILYVDMTTKASSQGGTTQLGMGDGGSNVILSGRMYINGIGTFNGITYEDGVTAGTWKMTENGPEGIGHAFRGTEVTTTFNGTNGQYEVVRYQYSGWWETVPVEPCDYVDGKCTVCGEVE